MANRRKEPRPEPDQNYDGDLDFTQLNSSIRASAATGLPGIGPTSVFIGMLETKLKALKTNLDQGRFTIVDPLGFKNKYGSIVILVKSNGPSFKAYSGEIILPIGSSSENKIKLQLDKATFDATYGELPKETRINMRQQSQMTETQLITSTSKQFSAIILDKLSELPQVILEKVLTIIPKLKSNYPHWSITSDSLKERINDALKPKE